MFRLALAFVLGLNIVSSANAQENKSLIATQFCDNWEKMFETPKKYGEDMLFTATGSTFVAQTGQMAQAGAFFFVNQTTGSWSLINIYGDGIACMVQTGTDFEPYGGPQPKKGDGL
jgi:hypothetical protein